MSATLPHRFLGDEIVVIFFSCGTNMGSYFRFFFVCLCVCVEKHCFCTSGQKQCKVKLGSHWNIRLDTWMSWIHLLFGRRAHPSVRALHHLQAEGIIPVFRQQAIPIVFCAGTLHSTRIPFLNVEYRAVNTMKYTYLTHRAVNTLPSGIRLS